MKPNQANQIVEAKPELLSPLIPGVAGIVVEYFDSATILELALLQNQNEFTEAASVLVRGVLKSLSQVYPKRLKKLLDGELSAEVLGQFGEYFAKTTEYSEEIRKAFQDSKLDTDVREEAKSRIAALCLFNPTLAMELFIEVIRAKSLQLIEWFMEGKVPIHHEAENVSPIWAAIDNEVKVAEENRSDNGQNMKVIDLILDHPICTSWIRAGGGIAENPLAWAVKNKNETLGKMILQSRYYKEFIDPLDQADWREEDRAFYTFICYIARPHEYLGQGGTQAFVNAYKACDKNLYRTLIDHVVLEEEKLLPLENDIRGLDEDIPIIIYEEKKEEKLSPLQIPERDVVAFLQDLCQDKLAFLDYTGDYLKMLLSSHTRLIEKMKIPLLSFTEKHCLNEIAAIVLTQNPHPFLGLSFQENLIDSLKKFHQVGFPNLSWMSVLCYRIENASVDEIKEANLSKEINNFFEFVFQLRIELKGFIQQLRKKQRVRLWGKESCSRLRWCILGMVMGAYLSISIVLCSGFVFREFVEANILSVLLVTTVVTSLCCGSICAFTDDVSPEIQTLSVGDLTEIQQNKINHFLGQLVDRNEKNQDVLPRLDSILSCLEQISEKCETLQTQIVLLELKSKSTSTSIYNKFYSFFCCKEKGTSEEEKGLLENKETIPVYGSASDNVGRIITPNLNLLSD